LKGSAVLTSADISERLRATLSAFVADWGLGAEITAETSLVADLEFDSIDVIQFVVEMEKAFGSRNLGFQSLLMQEGRYIDDLEVGQIEAFLATRLAA
jgi:acyl carrier protein